MTIGNINLNSMLQAQTQLNQSAQNIASIASVVNSSELIEVSNTFTEDIISHIPIIATYEANAKAIEVQEVMLDTLLDIKV